MLHSVVARRYTSSIAHKLSAFLYTNFKAFALVSYLYFVHARWSIAARGLFANPVPLYTSFTLICSLGKIPQAECAYALCAYIALCGAESHLCTQAARLLQSIPRIANSHTFTPFTVSSNRAPQILLRVCRSGCLKL